MSLRKDQHTVGTPEKPRGQQTGFAGNPDQNRAEKKETPAIRGMRPRANKLAGRSLNSKSAPMRLRQTQTHLQR